MSDTVTAQHPTALWSNRFWVEIEGVLSAMFTEMSGMSANTEVLSYKEGGLNAFVHKLPIRTTFSNITLKRGMALTVDLWAWYEKTVKSQAERKDITIILYKPEDPTAVAMRWLIKGAYPVKWTAPTFGAKTNDFAVESLEIAYDWFEKEAAQ